MRIAFLGPECVPCVLSEPQPVSRPALVPDAHGRYPAVEYTAMSVVRKATPEEVLRWRFGE